MRWLVAGANGMLGQDLVAALEAEGEEVRGVGLPETDITDAASIARSLVDVDVVVNAAAYTAVDKAEEDEASAFTLNAVGPQLLARRAREIGARLVHISTDYVLDGTATEPYAETAPLAPASAYGRTKGAGEWAVRAESEDYLIVRTAWLYGEHGACFPKTMARLAAERDRLTVVADQVGQPTWTRDLADLVVRLVRAQAPSGVYHGTSGGAVSWHGFTQEIVRTMGKDPQMVVPVTSAEFRRPAPRPAYSVLGHDALRAIGVEPIGDWQERWRAASGAVIGA